MEPKGHKALTQRSPGRENCYRFPDGVKISVSTDTCPNFLSSEPETSLLSVARLDVKEDDERSKAPEAPVKAPEAPNGLGDPRIGALEGERFSTRILEVRSS